MAKIKFFALILKNAFKLFFKFYDQYPIRTKLKSKENQFFNHSFKNKVFLPYSKLLRWDY
ncbi:hypothetical protein FIM80_05680 [Helicobacter pylori]|nr:hypothetical protein FIM81_05025 [Helicobacter pylori]TPH42365.1 hypothetical protein FIM80_05680 [Helicobacter pylori]TPH61289.1 hypothetical protein FIM66_05180 [Helicobacter pylori]TPH67729.1 hypothetical protein FIM61_04245 [Helicobacter pylori]TPI07348.1 hypothetical protein FIM34_05105 [Helicobacter pylori]